MPRFPSYKTVKRASQRYVLAHHIRKVVGELDEWCCVYCGFRLSRSRKTSRQRLTLDHIQPLKYVFHLPLPVVNHPRNIALACYECNSKYGATHARDKEARFGRFKNGGGYTLPTIYLLSAEEYRHLPSTERTRLCSEIVLPSPCHNHKA